MIGISEHGDRSHPHILRAWIMKATLVGTQRIEREGSITAAMPALFVASAPMSSLRLKGLHLSGLLLR